MTRTTTRTLIVTAALTALGLTGLAPTAQADLGYCDGGMCWTSTYACDAFTDKDGRILGKSETWWVCYFICEEGLQTFIQATGGRVVVGTAYVQPSRMAFCGVIDCQNASYIPGAPECFRPDFSIGCAGGVYDVSFTCSDFGTPSRGGLGVCLYSWGEWQNEGWFDAGFAYQDTVCGSRAFDGGPPPILDALLTECVPPGI